MSSAMKWKLNPSKKSTKQPLQHLCYLFTNERRLAPSTKCGIISGMTKSSCYFEKKSLEILDC